MKQENKGPTAAVASVCAGADNATEASHCNPFLWKCESFLQSVRSELLFELCLFLFGLIDKVADVFTG